LEKDTDAEIIISLKKKVQEALINGASHAFGHKLMQLLLDKKDVFRQKFGPDATPFKTNLNKGATPIRCKSTKLY
jgi:hypothetical protein